MKSQKRFKILDIDAYLQPFESDIKKRMKHYEDMKSKILKNYKDFSSFANAHLYYGFHQTNDGWFYREWAPNADSLSLIGDFNNWNRKSHLLRKIGSGNWEIFIPGQNSLPHKSEVKVQVTANGKTFDRIPLYIKRVIQKDFGGFNGQIWQPKTPFIWTDNDFDLKNITSPLIYECHIGMSTESESIGTYNEFTEKILPKIKKAGYNTIQLMAIMEHPYYASFGYQVSNFYAISSRFGTPEDLKNLINTAHSMGIAVLLDLVHSHAVKNTLEGINEFDGSEHQFFHSGSKGNHPAWGTKLFNYGKPEVIHFLLSNIKFWLNEYHFDGFRFDGVTSMLYCNHGLGVSFDSYEKYFSMNTDIEAITYLQFANELIKEINPNSISIAEDMSGMPGMCIPIKDGGIGFDYRLAMGVPDFWIKTISNLSDEDWDLGKMWYELTTRRPGEKNIGYCESHDQALVGDKTIIFWLADKEMYWNMEINSNNHVINRAISLIKLIKLITFSLAGEGYLNFMGNEFGHPEWIDFPREGNNWSYKYARRQWSLSEDNNLKYKQLLNFDKSMLELTKYSDIFIQNSHELIHMDNDKKILVYSKGKYLFIFNFHPNLIQSVDISKFQNTNYKTILNTDMVEFGGNTKKENLRDYDVYFSSTPPSSKMPIASRTAIVLLDSSI
ncbi:alpha-amylase family glycosyl hydrolase [Clostridioides difficile]|uniref:alpha-amylase family glycosyl hydrolase n=1 Tax=Clostridioides difficile TaxID=1496 RepID=UPI003080F758